MRGSCSNWSIGGGEDTLERVSRTREFFNGWLENVGRFWKVMVRLRPLQRFRAFKSPPLAGLSHIKEGNSPKSGLDGWQPSPDQTFSTEIPCKQGILQRNPLDPAFAGAH